MWSVSIDGRLQSARQDSIDQALSEPVLGVSEPLGSYWKLQMHASQGLQIGLCV